MIADPDLPSGPPDGARISTWRSIRRAFPWLPRFWRAEAFARLSAGPGGLDGVIGWGYQPKSLLSQSVAGIRRLPYWRAEDGFLRSVGLGKEGDRAWSIAFDDRGLYYDARRPSLLEEIVTRRRAQALADRGDDLRQLIADLRISKYNNAPDRPVGLPPTTRRTLLVVDQVAGDLSIRYALSDPGTFARMLADAIATGDRVVLRAHPDVIARLARGHLARPGLELAGVEVVADKVSPHAVLDGVDDVWTVSSQLGFDALLRDKPVTCYGMPFYAGWGLTTDRAAGPAAEAVRQRRAAARPTIGELAGAALILYPRYVDPATGLRITAEQAVEGLAAARARALGDRP